MTAAPSKEKGRPEERNGKSGEASKSGGNVRLTAADNGPRYNPEIEGTLIGAALVDTTNVEVIKNLGVDSSWFYDPANARVWRAIEQCRHGLIEVKQVLSDSGDTEHADRVHTYIDAAPPTSAEIPWYVDQLREQNERRKYYRLGKQIIETAADGDMGTMLSETRKQIDDIENPGRNIEPANLTKMLSSDPPPHDAIFESQVDAGRLGALIAKAKQKKSFYTLQAAMSLAAGRDVLAWRVLQRRRVMLVQFEVHPDDMHRRTSRMATALGIDESDLAGWLTIYNAKASPWDGGDIAAIKSIGDLAKKLNVEVLIVDPIFRLQRDGNENIEFMRPLVMAFDRITVETGAFVWLVHHDTKGQSGDRDHFDRGSGSNVLGRAVYWSATMTPHENGDGNFTCIEAGGNGYPPSPGFTAEFSGARFIHREDVFAGKMTTVNSRKANLPDVAVMKAHALQVIGAGPLPLEMFMAKFRRQTGLGEKMERAVRGELIADGVLAVSDREKAQGGRKFIGTPETIRELQNKWGVE